MKKSGAGKNAADIPPYFRCPISFELMQDPVILSSGITYERSSIRKWLLDGNKACPVTRQALHSSEMIPNTTLKQLIDSWRSTKDEAVVEEVLISSREVGGGGGGGVALDELLESSCLQALSKLSKGHPVWKKVKVGDEFVQALVFLILDRKLVVQVDEDQAAALTILCTVSQLDSTMSVSRVLDSPQKFSGLLASSSKSVRTSAAKLLETLLSALHGRLKLDIDGYDCLIQGLVSLLTRNTDDDENHDHLQATLKSLLLLLSTSIQQQHLSRTIKLRMVRTGAPKLLIDLLLASSATNTVKQQALELLKSLSCCAEGREALAVDHSRTIPAILRCLLKISPQATEHGTFIAWALIVCHHRHHCHAVEDSFIEGGGLSTMVMVLQCDCSMSTKHRAGELLKHFSWLWKDA